MNIVTKIIKLAIPMAIAQIIAASSIFFCMMMVAKLGHQVLAASSLITATQTTFTVIGMSLLLSISLLASHAYGAKNYLGVGNILQQGWTFGMIVSIPIMILFWHIGSILIYFGQNSSISAIVQSYFHAYVWGVIPLMLMVCNQQVCFGVKKQSIALLTSVSGVIVLLPLAYALIFGKWGMPRLGVAGLGYAVVAQYVVGLMVGLIAFYCSNHFKEFHLFRYRLHKDWRASLQMFKLGWPISLQLGGELLSLFFNATMVGWLGIHALAAYQVVNQYLFLIIIPIFALAQSTSILIGHAVGSKQLHEVKHIGHISMICGLCIAAIFTIVFIAVPKQLASLYLNVENPANAQTVHLIIVLFFVVAFSQLFDALRNIVTGALRGILDIRAPMLNSLIVIWLIGVSISYVLAFKLHLGVMGIALGSLLGMMIGAISLFIRWRYKTKEY